MAAKGLIDFYELRIKLAALEETREQARRELEALEGRRERLAELELDRDTLLERYAGLVPRPLDTLDAEQRHQLYKMYKAASCDDGQRQHRDEGRAVWGCRVS